MFGKIFNFGKKKLKLVTHDGPFHADDIFASAALSILFEKRGKKFEIIRSRDPKVFEIGDYVYDVGGAYDEAKNRFDHHQPGGAGDRGNGIPFSSLGLVWKKHGRELAGSEEAMCMVDEKLVAPVDAFDNGVAITESKGEIDPYIIQRVLESIMRPTWEEDIELLETFFKKNVELAKQILEREIVHAQAKIKAREGILKCYENSEDKRIVLMDKYYPLSGITKSMPEAMFLVSQRRHDGLWSVLTIRTTEDQDNFTVRKNLPKAWGGFRDEELQKITGVPDAVFCHNKLWLAVAGSKEGAFALAKLALSE